MAPASAACGFSAKRGPGEGLRQGDGELAGLFLDHGGTSRLFREEPLRRLGELAGKRAELRLDLLRLVLTGAKALSEGLDAGLLAGRGLLRSELGPGCGLLHFAAPASTLAEVRPKVNFVAVAISVHQLVFGITLGQDDLAPLRRGPS